MFPLLMDVPSLQAEWGNLQNKTSINEMFTNAQVFVNTPILNQPAAFAGETGGDLQIPQME